MNTDLLQKNEYIKELQISTTQKQEILSLFRMVMIFFGIELGFWLAVQYGLEINFSKSRFVLPTFYLFYTFYQYFNLSKSNLLEDFKKEVIDFKNSLVFYFYIRVIFTLLDDATYRAFKEVIYGVAKDYTPFIAIGSVVLLFVLYKMSYLRYSKKLKQKYDELPKVEN